jgi:CubicO group peptidase (beta-lactamase class C family)
MASRRRFIHQSGAIVLGTGILSSLGLSDIRRFKKELSYATPESQGISSDAIIQYLHAANASGLEHHGFILMRHGKIISEAYWKPYEKDHIHTLYSLSKSFTSTAIGMAVQEGKIKLTDKVISFFPDQVPDTISDHLAKMEIRHALNMATGHVVDTIPLMRNAKGVNWVKTFLSTPVEKEPGTHFLYNTGSSYTLCAIISKVTGMTTQEYLTPRLFKPLGILNPDWEVSPDGVNLGGYGLRVSTRDIIKFGQLYLQKGKWDGNPLINEAYVDEATTSHITSNPGDGDWSQGYGYQFWRCKPGFYRGDGAFGQFCIVMPQYDAVIAVNSESKDMQKQMTLLWENILPAMKDAPLTENKSSQNQLMDLSNNLSLNAVLGEKENAAIKNISGKTYQLAENTWGWKSLLITTGKKGGVLTLKKPDGGLALPFGWNEWLSTGHQIKNPFAADYRSAVPSAVVASAGGEGSDLLKLRLKYTDGIHGDLLTIKTMDDKSIEIKLLSSVVEKGLNNAKETREELMGKV